MKTITIDIPTKSESDFVGSFWTKSATKRNKDAEKLKNRVCIIWLVTFNLNEPQLLKSVFITKFLRFKRHHDVLLFTMRCMKEWFTYMKLNTYM